MKGRLNFVTLVSAALAASVALAAEHSERLYTRGLVEFHAGRYAEALRRFEQAVQADPTDPYALYYRGVTHGRLGEFAAAARDLQAALAAKPDLPQAALELGVALVHEGAYADAIPWLEQAQRAGDVEAQASLFRGIAELRLGQTQTARQNFARAVVKDPTLDLAARYYQGVADYRDGLWAQAQAHFSQVATTSPESAMGREAAAFSARIHRGAERPAYRLYGRVGFQYDSNVVLAPSNEAVKAQLAISKQADGRATLEAGGTYAPWRTERAALALGYDFYQSLHFDLDRFNLQDHRPSVRLVVQEGRLQLGLLAQYDYYFLRADSFLQEVTALPWITIAHGPLGRTEIFYRVRRRDFLKRPFSGVRDAFNHAPGVRQVYYLGTPARYAAVGYRFDREDPVNRAGNEFAYDGNEVNGGVGWVFPAGVAAEAEYAYRHEGYARQSGARRDDEHQIVGAVHKKLSDHLRLTAAYFGTLNNSNQRPFDYRRHIGSLALEARF